MNYLGIYLFSVMTLMYLVVTNYENVLVSLGMQMNEDKGFLSDFDLDDTPENRVKVANTLIFISTIVAPITLVIILASKLADKE